MTTVSVNELELTLFETPSQLVPLEESWRALAARNGVSYFATPDWVLSWWETLGRDLPGEVAVWRTPEGDPRAVVPLVRVDRRVHHRVPVAVPLWTNMGSGPGAADHCGFPVETGAAASVAGWLSRRGAERSLLLANLDLDARSFVPSGALLVGREACPRVELNRGELGSSKFRKRLRYQERRLAGEGVRLDYVPPGQVDESLLHILFELHEARRGAMGQGTSFDRSRFGLHHRLIERSGAGRGPAFVVARQGSTVVGLLYGLRWGDVFSYFQGGWRPEWADYSLGTVLVAAAGRLAREDGATVFDLLRGAEPYKYRLGATDRHDETWLVPAGLRGRALLAANRARAARSGGGS